MATLATDRPTHFQLPLKNDCNDLLQSNGTNVPDEVPTKCCYIYVDPKFNIGTLASD